MSDEKRDEELYERTLDNLRAARKDPVIHLVCKSCSPLDFFLADAINEELGHRYRIKVIAEYELNDTYSSEGDIEISEDLARELKIDLNDDRKDPVCVIIGLGWDEEKESSRFVHEVCSKVADYHGYGVPIVIVATDVRDKILSFADRAQFAKVLRIDLEGGPPQQLGENPYGKSLSVLFGKGPIGNAESRWKRLIKTIKEAIE